jgi:hypothetical protein
MAICKFSRQYLKGKTPVEASVIAVKGWYELIRRATAHKVREERARLQEPRLIEVKVMR